MRTEEMVHEINRLNVALQNARKQEDKWRESWRDAESWKNRLIDALNEIVCLPIDDNSYYAIAGNALGQARYMHPAEGKIPRVASQREYDLKQFESGITVDWNEGRPRP